MSTGLPMWTIYDHPRDYPHCYVARLFINDRPSNAVMTHATLQGLRAQLPPGLFRMPRTPEDDPVIVETWF